MDNEARILIVDDDENIRKVLVAILEDKGFNIEAVGTAKCFSRNSRSISLAGKQIDQ